MRLILILECIGLIAFAASGAYVAMQEELDLFGVFTLAGVTGIGGGVFRDIVTGVGIPVFFTSGYPIVFLLTGATAAVLLRQKFRYPTLSAAVDAVGLSAFVVSAGLKALENHYPLILFLFVAVITGVGGGMFRDMIVRRKPAIFTEDIYAVAALVGALALWLLQPLWGTAWAAYFALAVVFCVRMACYLGHVNLPIIRLKSTQTK